MNKKLLLVIFSFTVFATSFAQTRNIDTVAVSVLDKMSATIGSLSSCSFKVHVSYDINSKELGLIKHSDEQEIYISGSNKMLVRSEGDKGTRYYKYDGNTFTYFSMDKNHYGQIEAPSSVISMIDTISKTYGIEFPAADFFYPTFVDDIIAESNNLVYLGMTKVDGKECFHIAGTAKDKTFQFWISDDVYYLPVKMVIVRTSKTNSPQFEASISNWQINPNLPQSMFDFTPPPRSSKIRLIPISEKKQ